MSKKEVFIEEIEKAIDMLGETPENWFSSDALTYFNALKISDVNVKETKTFTENGKLVLQFIKDHKDEYGNLFKAKDIGEGLGISSRTASGAMRKLVNDEFVERLGESPVVYSLTEKGEQVEIPA